MYCGHFQLNQFEYIGNQNPHKKKQCDSTKQKMPYIVGPIFVAMSQCVKSNKTCYQKKYPVNHSLHLGFTDYYFAGKQNSGDSRL